MPPFVVNGILSITLLSYFGTTSYIQLENARNSLKEGPIRTNENIRINGWLTIYYISVR